LSHRQVKEIRNSAGEPQKINNKEEKVKKEEEGVNTLMRNDSSINPIQNLMQASEYQVPLKIN